MGGQKLRVSEVLMLQEKLKQKKFQKKQFLDFVFELKKPHIFSYKIIFKNHGFLIEKLEKLSIKVKIKKSSSLNFFHCNFFDNLEPFIAVSFLTPHDSRNLTTVKFLESAPPHGGSYSP